MTHHSSDLVLTTLEGAQHFHEARSEGGEVEQELLCPRRRPRSGPHGGPNPSQCLLGSSLKALGSLTREREHLLQEGVTVSDSRQGVETLSTPFMECLRPIGLCLKQRGSLGPLSTRIGAVSVLQWLNRATWGVID